MIRRTFLLSVACLSLVRLLWPAPAVRHPTPWGDFYDPETGVTMPSLRTDYRGVLGFHDFDFFPWNRRDDGCIGIARSDAYVTVDGVKTTFDPHAPVLFCDGMLCFYDDYGNGDSTSRLREFSVESMSYAHCGDTPTAERSAH
jgi:hypothetical protein